MIAYIDCFSGISGDMILGAFIDLGISEKWLKAAIAKIPLSGFDIHVSSLTRSSISGKKVDVIAEESTEHRNYASIRSLIEESQLSDAVKDISLNIFNKMAVAEAKIHNCPLENVHFHEAGGIDAIVDAVGTALCVKELGIDQVFASKIPMGKGFVSCEHGRLPVPVPAAMEILKGVPVIGTEIDHELVTPTGAAIITVLADTFGKMPEMTIQNIGYGAGRDDIENHPNLLRMITGTSTAGLENSLHGHAVMIETCIDDMNPEWFSFLMERLFEEGALDVYWVPVLMKKNRPGTMVQVLCDEEKRDTLVQHILSETTTLGVRFYDVQRIMLERVTIDIKTRYGTIQAKQVTNIDGSRKVVPEYEVCREIAVQKGIPVKTVYDHILKDAGE